MKSSSLEQLKMRAPVTASVNRGLGKKHEVFVWTLKKMSERANADLSD
jgi:hypothetical protein